MVTVTNMFSVYRNLSKLAVGSRLFEYLIEHERCYERCYVRINTEEIIIYSLVNDLKAELLRGKIEVIYKYAR